MEIAELFKTVQEACVPGVWAQGITLTRSDSSFVQDSINDEEVTLRIIIKNKPVSPRVTLAVKDLDWYCDCGDRNDPCAHVAAAVIAMKRGGLVQVQAAQPAVAKNTHVNQPVPYVSYRFSRAPGGLLFERYLVVGKEETKIPYSLLAVVGGSQSGRLSGPRLAATKADFSVDHILKARGSSVGTLDRRTLHYLLTCLENVTNVLLDGKPIRTSTRPAGVRTRLIDDGEGFRLQRYQATAGCESFGSGVVLDGNILRPVEHTKLTPQEEDLLANAGQYYPPEAGAQLVTEILPSLEKKTPIEILSVKLPKLIEVPPRALLKLDRDGPEELSVVANIVYGDPPIALVIADNPKLLPLERGPLRDVVRRDTSLEHQLMQKLRMDLNMQLGRRISFRGQEAVRWVAKLKGWNLTGDGAEAFKVVSPITPKVQVIDGGFNVSFETEAPGGRVDPGRMFRAWRENADFVPLVDGGWAPLPRDWMRRYGKRIQDLLAAKDAGEKLPPYLLPELAQVCDELGQEYPDTLANLKRCLTNFDGIPEFPLPPDLKADLRGYQRKGVNWLCFLRDSQLGALLADDMGLGKTLQALCAIRGRTLVVAPTSVLYNWQAELRKFRPSLKCGVYYGAGRALDTTVDVTLTTYALLRLDQKILSAESWDTVILDEAQTIKNPDSQVARAAHQLQGAFKLALSGTPVENHLNDLWSQFQFINPGLLGAREIFQDQYVTPITRGDNDVAARLRSRIKPFILRRLKRSVAPELPERTETVLRCELTPHERELYESILVSSRKEVMAELESGGNVLAALEVLLRLRQACCHTGLIPGQRAEDSSKVDLLMETLDESLEQGHKSLIFSQWTSYLDIIERQLKAKNIPRLRIDGSTQNRQDVVNAFQSADGPPIMLISLKAGGTGLTLTAADHIFIMDPWWNPAVEDQAADRAHRIGQRNPVLIHRLVAQETVEERILLLQQRKKELAASVLDGGQGAISLTRNDILDLLRG